MIHFREPPLWFGRSSIGMKNFVASTTSSRRPCRASPTISSDTPPEYTSAVSTKLIPASRARWMTRIASARSSLPHGPNIIAPRHSGLTDTPVRPSNRYSMSCSSLFVLAAGYVVDGGEAVEGAGVADEGHEHGQHGEQPRAGVADPEVPVDVPAYLSVGPAQGDEHRERKQLAHLQVDATAPDGVAEAVGGQVALEVRLVRRGAGEASGHRVVADNAALNRLAVFQPRL